MHWIFLPHNIVRASTVSLLVNSTLTAPTFFSLSMCAHVYTHLWALPHIWRKLQQGLFQRGCARSVPVIFFLFCGLPFKPIDHSKVHDFFLQFFWMHVFDWIRCWIFIVGVRAENFSSPVENKTLTHFIAQYRGFSTFFGGGRITNCTFTLCFNMGHQKKPGWEMVQGIPELQTLWKKLDDVQLTNDVKAVIGGCPGTLDALKVFPVSLSHVPPFLTAVYCESAKAR